MVKRRRIGGPNSRDARIEAKILKIAREMFWRYGYSDGSMSMVAAKLGGSKTTLYRRYRSKKDLFLAVTKAENERVLKYLFTFDSEPADIEKALTEFCRRQMMTVLADDTTAFWRTIIGESGKFPEIGKATYESNVRHGLDLMEKVIRQAMDRGQLRNADARAAAELLLDLGTGFQLKMRLWNYVKKVPRDAVDVQVTRMMTVFMATYGTDEACKKVRATDSRSQLGAG